MPATTCTCSTCAPHPKSASLVSGNSVPFARVNRRTENNTLRRHALLQLLSSLHCWVMRCWADTEMEAEVEISSETQQRKAAEAAAAARRAEQLAAIRAEEQCKADEAAAAAQQQAAEAARQAAELEAVRKVGRSAKESAHIGKQTLTAVLECRPIDANVLTI